MTWERNNSLDDESKIYWCESRGGFYLQYIYMMLRSSMIVWRGQQNAPWRCYTCRGWKSGSSFDLLSLFSRQTWTTVLICESKISLCRRTVYPIATEVFRDEENQYFTSDFSLLGFSTLSKSKGHTAQWGLLVIFLSNHISQIFWSRYRWKTGYGGIEG